MNIQLIPRTSPAGASETHLQTANCLELTRLYKEPGPHGLTSVQAWLSNKYLAPILLCKCAALMQENLLRQFYRAAISFV